MAAESLESIRLGDAKAPSLVLYGITPCDQVRKARHWLAEAGIPYRFHDFRQSGLDADHLNRWLQRLPWDALLNRRGTTWRALTPEQRQSTTDQFSAARLMLEDLRLIKRPVLERGNDLLVGFSEPLYRSFFAMSVEHTQRAPTPHD